MKNILFSVIALTMVGQAAFATCSQDEAVGIAQHIMMSDMNVLHAQGVTLRHSKEDASAYYFVFTFKGAKTDSDFPQLVKQGGVVTVSKQDCRNVGSNYGDFNATYADESFMIPANAADLK